MLLLATNIGTPADMDSVRLEIRQATASGEWGAPLVAADFRVPDETTLPTTYAIAAGETDRPMVQIRLMGQKGSAPIVIRKAELQVPRDRVAALKFVLASSCVGQVTVGPESEVEPSCENPEESCQPDTGTCAPSQIDAATLPTYAPGDENRIDAGVGSRCAGPSQQSCGNCGTQTRTCGDDGSWSAWSDCSGEGVLCPDGKPACTGPSTQDCTCVWSAVGTVATPGAPPGTESRTCKNSTWGSWGACGGVCPTSADISAGQGASSAFAPSAVIDTANRKVLVVASNGVNSGKPSLFRCNLDGSGCTHTDISAGQGAGSCLEASAVIDAAHGKLLAVATNTSGGSNVNKLSLFRCNLDGSSCGHTDISAATGQGDGSGMYPSAVIDAASEKLLVVTENFANSHKLSLFRCNLDGSGCTHTDISTAAAQGANSGVQPAAVIDAANGKLLVATSNQSNAGKPSLFRCNLDGSGCTHTDISAGQGTDSGWRPSPVIDAANGKLLVVASNGANAQKPSLFRCNLDGSNCTHTDISAGQGDGSGPGAVAVIDAASGKLLVVSDNFANSEKPALFRCNLDGSSCTHTDISAGQGEKTGVGPSAVIDTKNKRLLTVTQGPGNDMSPTLFSVGLW